jgi:hypothetical protein
MGLRFALPGAMPEVFVNDVLHEIGWTRPTWGELLATLDETAADQGQLLTTARFDGVEEPSFRDPQVTARRLTQVQRIHVETATPGAFLRQCLLDTIRPLEQASEMAARLSAVYRGRDVAPGHAGLSELAIELRGLTSIIAMLNGPLGVDISSWTIDGESAADQMNTLGAALDALVAAQESEDWVTVADILEYDLEPAIRRWMELLTMVANRF